MAYFHYRCGERITLLNDNCTAVRNDSEFDHGLVISAEPLTNDVLFEIKIDRKVNSWSGSLEIGVVDCDPLHFEFPPCASKIQSGSWIMSATSLFRNGLCLVESYGLDLDKLNQDDRIGLLRTSEGDLIFYINGESQGVAAEGLPSPIYAIVDLYGKCVQVTITSPALREHNNDDCLSGSSVLAIENDVLNVTLGGDLSELSLSSSNSLDIRMDMNVSVSLPEESTRQDKVRFHDRCGFLVKLSNGNRSAERRRPLDEFNNGVVMTHRPLKDSELFEIRIDRLVDKWSGSIEMGITTHNPSSLVFPATMTNMRSGTIMMSGCGILTNGKGTRREYGDYNLDELSEGDRVGMMRKPDGNLHYFINGIDQGIAAQRVPMTVWAVIDLYGMTIKVSIVERDEREEQNLITRKNTRDHNQAQPIEDAQPLPDYYDRLTFHPNCGTHAQVINNGRTAHRPNAVDDFNNGVVLTARPLKIGELFEVRLDRVVTKWAGSIEIGVTTHNPVDLDFPFTMTNVRSGTWMMTGSGIMHNGTIVLEQYGVNLDRLQVGDRVGVVRKENGTLHFFVNAVDQGSAATNVPEKVYGVIDLYGQAVESSIVDQYDYRSPDTMISSFSNTLYSDLRFHHVHGRNARIINNGVTAMRPRPLAEFNEAIVFSNRPLRDGELFEVCLDTIVDRWSGSIELGVTAVRPDDLELPSTATDLYRDTIMLSGSSVMVNGKTLKNNYLCDLDMLTSGVKLGIMRSADKSLEFYKNGVPQGVACTVTNTNIYAVVDLYGQCAQVSISCASPMAPLASVGTETCPRSDTSVSLQATSVIQPPIETDLHRFSAKGKGFVLSENARIATRNKDFNSCIVYSSTPLVQDELFEISIVTLLKQYAGNLAVGVSAMPPGIGCNSMSSDCCYLSGNELRYKNKILQFFTPSLNWLNCEDRIGILRTQDGNVKIFLNGEELAINFPSFTDALYGVFELRGACSEVSVLSHKTPLSPLNSMRLQDSLEWTIDQEQAPSDLIAEDKEVALDGDAGAVKHVYEFNENHGRNIELIDERKVARRVASYNQGIVIVQPALEFNSKVEVVVEQLDGFWQSSLIVGLICGPADRLTLPVNALSLKGSSCVIVANDWISVNGAKMRSNYGQALAKLKVGDTVGLILSETKHLQLVVNGVEGEGLAWVYPNGNAVHAVFDLYGQCQQIQIVNTPSADQAPSTSTSADCEKADLESCEKERSNTNLSLPLQTSASCSTNAATVNNSKPSMHTPITIVSKNCPYKEEAEKMKSKLLLPDHYFAKDDPVCYCTNCFKVKCEDGEKENGMEGWVRFPLRGAVNNAEKWHAAFYASKIGAVRCILDRGQPLTKGQAQFCNLTAQKADDVQVVFYPSLDSCKMQSRKMDNKEVHVAFQLFVKPGAYSISRESDCVEWSTKETGALVLNALLFQIR